MKPRAYYNEIDPYAAEWLRRLAAENLIMPGDVDERSIEDVAPDDLRDYTQCHFFAGIGVWSYAARRAGWPDERPLWTGSCPCQPFSAAGKRSGKDDERHLWPTWHGNLITECRPPVILGEQVASRDGLGWLDDVQADLEVSGYAFGAVDTCSAGVGAPHIRQRLRFVAERMGHDDDTGLEGQRRGHQAPGGRVGAVRPASAASQSGRMADSYSHEQRQGRAAGGKAVEGLRVDAGGRGELRGVADHHGEKCTPERNAGRRGERGTAQGLGEHADNGGALRRLADADLPVAEQPPRERTRPGKAESPGPHSEPDRRGPLLGHNRPTGPTNGFWGDADWLFCRDGKWRPVEPGTFPLAHGATARVGRLRAYGNAVDAEATRVFIEAVMGALNEN